MGHARPGKCNVTIVFLFNLLYNVLFNSHKNYPFLPKRINAIPNIFYFRSGGPLRDIIIEESGSRNGFLAATAQEYAAHIAFILG